MNVAAAPITGASIAIRSTRRCRKSTRTGRMNVPLLLVVWLELRQPAEFDARCAELIDPRGAPQKLQRRPIQHRPST